MENSCYPFVNLPLPYSYDALEPVISAQTMHLHHDKHLQTYINNLNDTLKDEPSLQGCSLEKLIKSAGRLPVRLQAPVRNNAGGVYNHRFFFHGLAPVGTTAPHGALLEQINCQFGGLEPFRAAFQKAALSVFGSGYAWLVLDRRELKLVTTPNQNSPLELGLHPILAIDVWEHAYYLDYFNVRASYIDAWFQILNWEQAEHHFLTALPVPAC